MGYLYLETFEEDRVFACKTCGTHLSTPSHIESKASSRSHLFLIFKIEPYSHAPKLTISRYRTSTERQGRLTSLTKCKCLSLPYTPVSKRSIIHVPNQRLGSYRINFGSGPPEDKVLATGLHRVRDIYCAKCLTVCGWRYVSAPSRR